jgi:hypothetical protein
MLFKPPKAQQQRLQEEDKSNGHILDYTEEHNQAISPGITLPATSVRR